MKPILSFKVPDKYDIIIAYTWQKLSHKGMDGHLFEVLDYYLLLSQFYKVGMFIGDDISKELILEIVKDRYDSVDTSKLEKDLLFGYSPRVFLAQKQTIIVVDGHLQNIYDAGGQIYYKNLISFRCGKNYSFSALEGKDNCYLLQDNRLYNTYNRINTYNYVKKINFLKLRKRSSHPEDCAFLYLTPNCRELCTKEIENIKNQYNYTKFLICDGAPIPDLFNKISTYIYTPIFCKGRMNNDSFDCSPRLIAECAWHDIPVEYHNIDYEDIGLETRKKDIEEDIEQLSLDSSDFLLQLLKEIH